MTHSATGRRMLLSDAVIRLPAFKFGVYPLLFSVSIVGTSLLLIFVARHRRQTKLPPSTGLAVCALLAVNLLELLLRCTTDLLSQFLPHDLYDSHRAACFGLLTAEASAATLQGYIQGLISVERVLAVTAPLKVKRWVTARRMGAAVVFVALLVTVTQVVYVLFGFSYTDGRCSSDEAPLVGLGVMDTVIYFGLPFLLLTVCSVVIVAVLVCRRRKYVLVRDSRRLNAREVRLAVTLAVMDVIYLCTVTPYTVVMYLSPAAFLPESTWAVVWHCVWLATLLSCATDWIILLCLASQIRRGMARWICRRTHSASTMANNSLTMNTGTRKDDGVCDARENSLPRD